MPFAKSKVGLCGGAAIAALLWAGQAYAQEPAGVEEIIVTGSRVIRDGTQAPTPLTVLTTEAMDANAPVSIADALIELPQFANSTTPASAGNGVDDTGASYLNLRNLGRERGLVLMDGVRLVTSAATGAVDMNAVPQVLIERTEVVTGGASAAYGSNAVAGVLNLVTDQNFEGLKFEAQYGESSRGDNQSYSVSVGAGGSFADGRGHITVSGEYARSLGIQRGAFFPDEVRPWTNWGQTTINNPAVNAQNPISASNPRLIVIDNIRFTQANVNGVINAGPLANNQFNADGSLRAYNPGLFRSGQFASGGDGWSWLWTTPLEIPYRRHALYGKVTFDLIPEVVTAYFQGFTSYNHGYATGNPMYTHGQYTAGIPIRIDNPYLAPSTVARMQAAGLTQIGVALIPQNLQRRGMENKSYTTQVIGGFQGTIAGRWDWDVSYSYGQNDNNIDNYNNINLQNFNLAIDAVRAPNGQIVCRSTLTNPNNGCSPYNPMGNNPQSAATLAYVQGDNRSPVVSQQTMVDANVSGELFTLPAGPVGAAVGVHWRKEEVTRDADQVSLMTNPLTGRATGAWVFGNLQPFSGSQTVKEAYGEVNVPLLSGVTLAESLSVNGAARRTDYELSGGVTTWKLGASWTPVNGLRFRGTRSRDIRAPIIIELFSGAQQGQCSVLDRVLGVNVSTTCFSGAGNRNLRPEVANTLTYGLVFQPDFLPGFNLAVDRYDIDLRDAIGNLSNQLIMDQCVTGNAETCALITRNPANNAIQSINSTLLNLNRVATQGWDIDVGYTRPLDDFTSLPGTVQLRMVANYVENFIQENQGSPSRDIAGGGAVPHWRATINLGYNLGGFQGGMQVRWVGKHKFDNTLTELDLRPSDNAIAPEMFVNLTARYRFELGGANMEVFGVIENILDPTPPTVPGGFNSWQTNRQVYDPVGRQFRGGLRVQY